MRSRLKALRVAVGALVLLAFVAFFGFMTYVGRPIDTLWELVMVAIVFASGYAVFGDEFGRAVDDAKDVTDGDSDASEQSEGAVSRADATDDETSTDEG